MHLKIKVQNVMLVRLFVLATTMLFSWNRTSAQVITGPSCVNAGTQYAYHLYYAGGTYSYTITGGTLSTGGTTGTGGPGAKLILVTFTTNGSVGVTGSGTGNPTQTVSVATPLTGGTITAGQTQSINNGAIPGSMTCSAATGSGCSAPSYSYQWMSSTDNINYTNISTATSQNISFSAGITQTTYYKRSVYESVTGSTAYSTVATVTVYPAVVAGSVTPGTQTINYNTTASVASAGVSGGTNSYAYQWQNSPDNTTWTNVTGGTSATYTTPFLTALKYYRVGVSSNGSAIVYSTSATVNVYPQVVSGTVSPTSQTINYSTVPATLSTTTATGGNGTYTYQWYNSPNGSTWTLVSGATSTTYTPPALTATTYYHVVATSNGASATSSSLLVTVYAQLVGGSVTPAAPAINYNTSPGVLTLGGVTGGSGTYTYQWQSSTTSGFTSPVSISGAIATTYTPANLTASIYYRVGITSNGVTAYSNYTNITVYPPLVPGSASPSSQNILGGSTAAMSNSGVSGGSGTYTYQWQNSPDNVTFTNISAAIASSYTSPPLSSTTYYRVGVTSNGVTGYSLSASVNVQPPVQPGSIEPLYTTITTGTSPGALTGTAATLGACGGSYGYQWQSSTDGITFGNVPSGGAGVNYTPGNLSVNTWFRRQVSCTPETKYSNVIQVAIVSGTPDINFVRVRDIMKPGVLDSTAAAALTSPYDVAQTTQYFDGLGRQIQTVAMQQSPLQKDMVSFNVYDMYGREAMKNLAYTATNGDGNYKTTPEPDMYNFNSNQFPSEQYFYSLTNFEPSPLNRPVLSMSPGISWVGSSRGLGAQYQMNTSTDSVRYWTVAFAPKSLPTSTAIYSVGNLFKNISKDENGNAIIEYKDLQGKVVLKKQQLDAIPGTAHQGWLCTYYIYDDLNNLRYVVQPKAVVAINGSWTISQAIADELCFRYEYDYRSRLVIKKLPGAGEVWLIYDLRDRLAMTQDSSLRAAHQWLFTKYDTENRPDSTGLITDPTNYNNLTYHQNLAASSIYYPIVSSYTNQILTQSFYDDYGWIANYGGPIYSTMYHGDDGLFVAANNVIAPYARAITQTNIVRGTSTGSRINVLGSSSQFLYEGIFYDDRGRVLQTQSPNITGCGHNLDFQYDFASHIIGKYELEQDCNGANPALGILSNFEYDHGSRLLDIKKTIYSSNGVGNSPLTTMVNNTYNELGQLREKIFSNSLDSLLYDYNIRGWLSAINKNYVAGTANSHYFGMELGYDKTTSAAPGNTYATAEYNGNITGTVWKSAGSGLNRKYDFTYDNVNRLAAANFGQYSGSGFDVTAGIDFTTSSLTYDANGNILSMNQKGFTVGGSNLIDQLTYTYQTNSNKLTQVNDAQNNPTSLLGDFHYTGSKGATDYTYDGNGNLVTDANKSIDHLNYNYLNLPQLVHMNTKGNIVYTYDAMGNKLQKTVIDSAASKKTVTTYIGSFVHQGSSTLTGTVTDTLQFISTEEGRIRWAFHKYTTGVTAYAMEYDFFEKDHLGNTRMVLTSQKDTANYLASMESAYRTNEAQLFSNITNTSYARASVSGYPSTTTITNPNDSVSKVDFNGTSGQKMGPSLLMKVMSGDNLSIAVQSYYNTNSITTSNSSFTDVLNSLANGIVNVTGGAHGTVANLTASGSSVYSGLNSFLTSNDPAPPAGYPKAYLNWIFLDDQFNYVSSSSGSVKAASATYPAATLNAVAPGSAISITKNGYLYIWVSNETQGWDVFFDNLSVQYRQGPLLEENHYYPFGLTMQGISDKALKTQYGENRYRYNGKELQNKEFTDGTGLEEFDFGARMQDPQLGVWHNSDPLADFAPNVSPYSYCFDNPIWFEDPTGMEGKETNGDDDKVKVKYVLDKGTGKITAQKIGDDEYNKATNNGTGDNVLSFEKSEGDYLYADQSGAIAFQTGQFKGQNASDAGQNYTYVGQLQWGGDTKVDGTDVAGKINDYVIGAIGAFETTTKDFVIGAAMNSAVEGQLSARAVSILAKIGTFSKFGIIASKAGPLIGTAIGGVKTYNGWVADGNRFGKHAKTAAIISATSVAGGWAGAEGGAALGAAIGVWFGGVGAVPGAIIGGIIGGIVGSWGGEKIGDAISN